MAYNPARLSLLAAKLQDAGIVCQLSLESGVATVVYDKAMTDQQKTDGDAIIQAFDFDKEPPLVRSFLKEVVGDDSIPASLYPYIPMLRELVNDPESLKLAWSKIESSLGLALSAQAKAAIEGHMDSANFESK